MLWKDKLVNEAKQKRKEELREKFENLKVDKERRRNDAIERRVQEVNHYVEPLP
jgi:hypothetical protein